MTIQKILTLSTAHITEETAAKLEEAAVSDDTINLNGIAVYEKDCYGWFLYPISPKTETCPEDLKTILKYAEKYNCSIICLDRDEPKTEELPAYDW